MFMQMTVYGILTRHAHAKSPVSVSGSCGAITLTNQKGPFFLSSIPVISTKYPPQNVSLCGDDAHSSYQKTIICTNRGARTNFRGVPRFLQLAVKK